MKDSMQSVVLEHKLTTATATATATTTKPPSLGPNIVVSAEHTASVNAMLAGLTRRSKQEEQMQLQEPNQAHL